MSLAQTQSFLRRFPDEWRCSDWDEIRYLLGAQICHFYLLIGGDGGRMMTAMKMSTMMSTHLSAVNAKIRGTCSSSALTSCTISSNIICPILFQYHHYKDSGVMAMMMRRTMNDDGSGHHLLHKKVWPTSQLQTQWCHAGARWLSIWLRQTEPSSKGSSGRTQTLICPCSLWKRLQSNGQE